MTWFWLALSAAVLWGLGYTINQNTLKVFSPLELLFFESLIIAVILGIYLLISGKLPTLLIKLQDWRNLGLIALSSFIYMAASILIFTSINSSNATIAAIIESCYPIFTVIFAFLIFGEIQLNLISALGFVLIIAGIILVKLYNH
ncbi:MAG: hypothetical protein EKK57_08445 [Proteobacteria bacterium]|nr:MAG: hypothetical protein EKK57_08445 [Pseudomonadota bacterium]